ncbi:MAG TPA: hypothetical protein VFQ35_08810 [Polyangiaceae bacterium]|nr:hypothetical protein [Polyangiaceae bacterium]
MPTQVLAPVTEGNSYVVKFTNRVESTGVVLVVVGWVPKHERPVPPPQHMVVAPGATAEIGGKVPPFADARRMVIVASLDPGESGRLVVIENDVERENQRVTETTTWEALVEEKSEGAG